MVAVMTKVEQSEQDRFLFQVEKKFLSLLDKAPDPKSEIQEAARRLLAVDLLWTAPSPSASLRQAASEMISENDLLKDQWLEIKTAHSWESALTPAELVTSLLPSSESLA